MRQEVESYKFRETQSEHIHTSRTYTTTWVRRRSCYVCIEAKHNLPARTSGADLSTARRNFPFRV